MDEQEQRAYVDRLQAQLEARYGRPLTAEERQGLERAVADQLAGPPSAAQPTDADLRGYEPIHPGGDLRKRASRYGGAVLAFAIAVAKLGVGGLKFASVFVAVAAYSLIWGWRFAIGFVSLIAIHELGHVFEARRQGLAVTWPTFIPFFGAYVRHSLPASPFDGALISLSGPFWGGIGALAFLLVGRSGHSPMLQAMAYTGFLLNLINLLPVGFLDGGQAWRAHKELRAAGDRRAGLVVWMHGLLAGLLVLAMIVSHVPQTRL